MRWEHRKAQFAFGRDMQRIGIVMQGSGVGDARRLSVAVVEGAVVGSSGGDGGGEVLWRWKQ